MKYTLKIIYDGMVVVMLYFNNFGQAHGAATLLKNGVAENFAYRIEIYDNQENSLIYKDFTY